jgi:hypothetical protein
MGPINVPSPISMVRDWTIKSLFKFAAGGRELQETHHAVLAWVSSTRHLPLALATPPRNSAAAVPPYPVDNPADAGRQQSKVNNIIGSGGAVRGKIQLPVCPRYLDLTSSGTRP